MKKLGIFGRFLAALQLLPALESGEETLVGGQAVLEGVMMRSPHAWRIAVRKVSGEMVTHSETLDRPSEKHKWMGWPIVRGVVILGHAMMLGFRALRFSANVALEEATPKEAKKLEISGWVLAVNLVFSIGFFIFMYKYLPLVATTALQRYSHSLSSNVAFGLVDGLIRISLFLLFIWGVSRFKDIHRVFEYHGAEHKTVFAFESGEPVSIPAAQKFSTYHPRCGTSFLMTVMIISMIVFAVVPATTFWTRFAVRVALLPVIAGVSYELIRFAGKLLRRQYQGDAAPFWRSGLFVLMTRPGMWLQRITTQPPADGQVECAIRALDEAMALEKQRGGELVIA
jgi:uncharacterized protein YqhQ